MRAISRRWLSLTLAGAFLTQWWSCIGTDPQFFFTNTIATTATSILVTELISGFFQQLAAAAAA